MCKISVIVPVYNVEKSVEKCIESVLNQTYMDIEVVIVNDETPDRSRELVEQYTDDKRIKIIDKENEGLPQARKTGVEHASGEYLFFLDSDDWIEPNTLETLYTSIKEEKADIACCNIEIDYIGSDKKEYIRAKENGVVSQSEAIRLIHSTCGVFQYAWNKLYRRDIVDLDDFPYGHFIGEDYCTVLSILEKTDKIVQIPDVLYHYVQNDGGMTKKGFGEIYVLAYQWNVKIRNKLFEQYPNFKNEIMSYHILQDMAVLNAMFRNDIYNEKLKAEIIKTVRRNLWMYITNRDVKLLYKICAAVISLNWKIYRCLYKGMY